MQRPRLESATISREEQPAPDHIDGPGNDRRPSRIVPPLGIIGKLASKRADRERDPVVRPTPQSGKRVSDFGKFRRVKPLGHCLRLVRRLIDHNAAVYHPYQPPRHASAVSQRKQPYRHHRGLPTAGRNTQAIRNLIRTKLQEQPFLPGERLIMPAQSREVPRKECSTAFHNEVSGILPPRNDEHTPTYRANRYVHY